MQAWPREVGNAVRNSSVHQLQQLPVFLRVPAQQRILHHRILNIDLRVKRRRNLLVESRSSCLRWWVLRKMYLKYFLTFCLFYSWNHEAPVCVGEYWEVVFKIFFIFCFLFFLLVKSRSSCLRWWVLRKLYLKYFLIFCLFYSLNHEAPVCVVELRENRLDSNYDVLISVNFINYKNNSLINLVNSLNLF